MTMTIINVDQMEQNLFRRDLLINEGSIQDVIEFAKSFDIHQDITKTTSYNVNLINRIKERLISEGIDPETVRSE